MAAHPECRDKAPLPCVPCGSGAKTPSKAGQGYTRGLATLADDRAKDTNRVGACDPSLQVIGNNILRTVFTITSPRMRIFATDQIVAKSRYRQTDIDLN